MSALKIISDFYSLVGISFIIVGALVAIFG